MVLASSFTLHPSHDSSHTLPGKILSKTVFSEFTQNLKVLYHQNEDLRPEIISLRTYNQCMGCDSAGMSKISILKIIVGWVLHIPFLQVFMGIFYYVNSVALFEDLPLEEKEDQSIDEFYTAAEKAYAQVC